VTDGSATLSATLSATVDSIAALQQPGGMILRAAGGLADPWTHVEAAMALTVGGRGAEAERAYEWLASTQRADGAWSQYYRADGGVEVDLLDANFTAYVATGVWRHFVATGDAGFLAAMWPVVDRAMAFVAGLQAPGGEIRWARHADGTPWPYALLTASSSTYLSLRCAAAIADRLGAEERASVLAAAAGAVADAIVHRPWSFLPKHRWAMDWYYPVLVGVAGAERLAHGWPRFVIDGWGVRCVDDRPWVTAAETCEAAMAYLAVGEREAAARLFSWVHRLRAADGSYFTGRVAPGGATFPAGERTTYSSAAVVLAADALAGGCELVTLGRARARATVTGSE